MDFKFYFSLFLRRLPYFLVIFAMCSAIGITLAQILPPVYRAEARLLVEGEQIPGDLAESTITIDPTEIISRIEQEITSRNNLIEVAQDYDVYEPDADGVVRISAEDRVEDMRARFSIEITGGAQRRGPNLATIVTVSFAADNAQTSAAVTNEFVTQILSANEEFRKGQARDSADFFERLVNDLADQLDAQDTLILTFQQENSDALPESLNFREEQLERAQDRMAQLEREEAILENNRAQMVALMESGALNSQAAAPQVQTAEARQLQRMRDELSGLLATLSPTHPRVRQLEGQIAALEPRVAEQEAAAGANPETATGISAAELRLNDILTALEFNRVDQARLRGEMEELESNIQATYANRTELRRMERTYSDLQAQHSQAVASLAQAATGETIEELGRGGRIRENEAARAPDTPESPNRVMIAAGGIGGGLFLGLAFVVLLELLNSSIRRPVDLTKRLGITALGAVPRIRTRQEIFKRRAIIAASFAFVLIALPAALWVVHTQVEPLDRVLTRVLSQVGLA